MDLGRPIELSSEQSLESAEAIDTQSNKSSDLGSDQDCKQLLFNLTPYLLIPETPARQTSDFFDRINNLDPVKFSPPESKKSPRKQSPNKPTMSNT